MNSNPSRYPETIRKTATSLYAVHGQELSLNQTAAAVISAIQTAYDTCILGQGKESIVEAWSPLSALSGKSVTAIMNGQEITGIANGIDESGALMLTQESGNTVAIRAGDVTLKK